MNNFLWVIEYPKKLSLQKIIVTIKKDIYICINVYMCMYMYDNYEYICMYSCMYVCMYVCMPQNQSSKLIPSKNIRRCKNPPHLQVLLLIDLKVSIVEHYHFRM